MNKKATPLSSSLSLLGVAITCAISIPCDAQGVTSTWNGVGTNNQWSTGANWGGTAPVPSTSGSLVFGGTTNITTNNDFTAGSSFTGLTFAAGSGLFTLNGNAITLGSGGITVSAAGSNGYNAPKIVNLDIATTAALAISVPTAYNNGNGMVALPGLTLNGVISGANNVTKSGNGTLALGGANTYTGVTTLTAGATQVSTINNGGVAGGLGAASNTATNLVFNGGSLVYTGDTASTNRDFSITAGKSAIFDIVNASTNLTWTGRTTTANNGGIAKIGLGTLTLTGNGSAGFQNTGATVVHAGNLVLDYSASGAPAANILSSSAPLTFGGIDPVTGVIVPASSATVTIQGGATTGTPVLQTFGTLNVQQYSSNHLNLVDGTGGAFQVTFAGLSLTTGGVLDFAKGANDIIHFVTTPTINSNGTAAQGTLSNSSNAGASCTLNGTDWATVDASNNVVATTYATNFLAASRVVDVTASGMTAVNGEIALRFNTNIGATNTLAVDQTRGLAGILETTNVGANAVVVTGGTLAINRRAFAAIQNNTAGDLTINSAISSDTTAGVGIVKAGAGRLILGGANTTCGISINEGTVQISSKSNLGLAVYSSSPLTTAYNTTTIGLNGTLEVRGGNTITLDGVGTQSGIYAQNIQIGTGNGVIDVDAGTTLAVTGGINGNTVTNATIGGTLTKTGEGTLNLSGVNYSAGGLVVNGGTVIASGVGNAATGTTFTTQGLSIGGVTTTIGSNQITFGTSSSDTKNLQVGQAIIGTNIQANTTITGVTVLSATSIQLTLSNNATASGAGTVGINVFMNAPTTAAFASGATSMTVGSAANIQVGQTIYGTGIAVGTVVTAVNGTTLTLNQATTLASDAGNYIFGGVNQSIASSTANLGYGQGLTSAGFNGYITGIQGNVVTTSGGNNGSLAPLQTPSNLLAWDSLGVGTVTVKNGTLDLGGLSHTTETLPGVIINGGTIKNGTLGSTSYTAAVDAGATATVSANLAGTGATLSKTGAGTLIVSGANTFTEGTTITTGTLLANNTTGSALGTGAVTVAATSTLGGTGFIAPTGAKGIDVSGVIAPGTTLGTLTLDLGNTTGKATMQTGASFAFDLGVANATIASIAAGSSDQLVITGASTGDFTFNLNNVDFLGTGQTGYYKLFDTSADNASTWSGLTYDPTTGIVTAGLSSSNLAAGLSGSFIVGTASNGGTAGDIYFLAVPEPQTWAMLISGMGLLLGFQRFRRSQAKA